MTKKNSMHMAVGIHKITLFLLYISRTAQKRPIRTHTANKCSGSYTVGHKTITC